MFLYYKNTCKTVLDPVLFPSPPDITSLNVPVTFFPPPHFSDVDFDWLLEKQLKFLLVCG